MLKQMLADFWNTMDFVLTNAVTRILCQQMSSMSQTKLERVHDVTKLSVMTAVFCFDLIWHLT